MATNLTRTDFVMVLHLQATWDRARRERQDPHLAVHREERCFTLVCQFDPTGGRYHGWLGVWRRRLWDVRGFRKPLGRQELDDVHRALAWFDDIRDRLPPDRRDIGRYHTTDDLRAAVPTRIAENRRRLEAEALKKRAYSQSEVLYREGRWLVVRLDGFVASRFWGLGTKWCTTGSEHVYRQYATGGEMVVFATPTGKYQLATRSQAFRDELDRPVARDAFRGAPEGFLRLLHRYCNRPPGTVGL